MPYYTNDDDEVDDFKDYDPMPYSGGYDITVTYGRSLPPSDETCYPLSSRSGDAFEYQRPVFSTNHEPSAYDDKALKTEYSSYSHPKPRPGGHGGAHVEGQYGGSGSGGSDFARKPNSGSGGRIESDYGHKSKEESHGDKKLSGKDYDDEKSLKKEKKKDKDKKKDGYNSGEDEKKKKSKDQYKHHDADDYDEKKSKKKDHHEDYDEKKSKKKDYHDDDEKKKKKDHHGHDDDEKKKKKEYHDYDEKKKKKDHHDDDDDKKKKKDHYKHHKGHDDD